MTLKLITAPATEPVTLAEAKVHLRIDGDELDSAILRWIKDARRAAEFKTGSALITQTWERVIDAFPAVEIDLRKPPVTAITQITYVDTDGVTQTMDAADYSLDADTDYGWVLPAYGVTWPATLNTANAVRVRFVCGYSSADDVPEDIKDWMLVQIGTSHLIAAGVVVGKSLAVLPSEYVDRKLDPYTVRTP